MNLCLSHAQAQEYAEDILAREQQEVEPATEVLCPRLDAVSWKGDEVLSEDAARAVWCAVQRNARLAAGVLEYGCTDRSEVIIGELLSMGVHPFAIGRMSSFYDTTASGADTSVFEIEDSSYGGRFRRAWQLIFGNQYPWKISLQQGDEEFLLDVDGTIRWQIGHIAPTLWVQGEEGAELRVLDAALGADELLSPEIWRERQNATQAALLWGRVGDAPDILGQYLPPAARDRLLQRLQLPRHVAVDWERVNSQLRASSPEMKAQLYAQVLQIEEKAAWHPRHWAGYAFTGDDLPDWDVTDDALMQRRYERATTRLDPLVRYEGLRMEAGDDVFFLEAVRELMRRNHKRAKIVTLDLTQIQLPEKEEHWLLQ